MRGFKATCLCVGTIVTSKATGDLDPYSTIALRLGPITTEHISSQALHYKRKSHNVTSHSNFHSCHCIPFYAICHIASPPLSTKVADSFWFPPPRDTSIRKGLPSLNTIRTKNMIHLLIYMESIFQKGHGIRLSKHVSIIFPVHSSLTEQFAGRAGSVVLARNAQCAYEAVVAAIAAWPDVALRTESVMSVVQSKRPWCLSPR